MHTSDKKNIEKIISGNSTKENAREAVDWLSSSVEGQQYLSDMLDKDAFLLEQELDTNFLPNANQSERIYRNIERNIFKTTILKISLRVAAILLPLILLTGITFYINRQVDLFGTSEFAEVYVSKGEKARLFFHDGTEVFLNADSKIRYPKKFGLTKRKVFLEGEAYFHISSNKKRPFIVNTGETSVKVLGTSFNINAYEDNKEIQVVLDEGEIVFAARNNEYKLNPGQKLEYHKETKKIMLQNLSNSSEMSLWKSNVVFFRDTPLTDVLKVLERKYNVTFEIVNADALRYSYTITTSPETMKDLLDELQKIAPVSFSIQDNKIKVSLS